MPSNIEKSQKGQIWLKNKPTWQHLRNFDIGWTLNAITYLVIGLL